MLRKIAGAAKGRLHIAWQSGKLLGSFTDGLRFALHAKYEPNQRWQAAWGRFAFKMRWRDWSAVQEVLVEEEYKLVHDCLRGIEKPVVLDLGANIGTFALYVLQHFPQAQVVSYEASQATYDVLCATKAANANINWQAHQAAVWSEDGSVSFSSTEYSPGSRVQSTGTEIVPARAFANVMAAITGQVDLAKVDVEGAEEAVLADMDAQLARISHLIVELHPGRCDTERVTATLRRVYKNIYQIPGRASSKPLLLCANRVFNLPSY